MYWILILVGTGSAYWAVQSIAPAIFVGIAVGLITLPIILAAEWINGFTGISHLLIGSWQALSGVDTPGEIIAQCEKGFHEGNYDKTTTTTFGDILISFLVLIIAIVNAIISVCAIVGLPLGLGVSAVGAFRGLATGNRDWMRTGLGILTFAVGAAIVAGLVMRLMHVLSASTCA